MFAQSPLRAHQLTVDAGVLSAGISYARQVDNSPWSMGAGLWGAWEPPNSFDRNVWEPLGATVFVRRWPTRWLHTDVGATAARYLWADDCSECSGTFVGLTSSVRVGSRVVSIGPDVSLGRASDDVNGAAWGVIWGAQARVILNELFR